MNWQRAFDDISAGAAARASAFGKLGPRARRRAARDGVLGAGALAAMIAAANAAEAAGDGQIAAADADAVDSLDGILSFAAVCAIGDGASDAGGAFHALHDGATGHEAHAFFEAAFASRFDSALCGDSGRDAHQGHGARTASNAHETHTDDHGAAAMLASAHAGHGAAQAASGDHAAHGAQAGHERMGAEEHAHDVAAQPFAAAAHGAHGAEAFHMQRSDAQSHDAHDAYDPYVLSALAGAQQNGADNGDVSAGLDALLGEAKNGQNNVAEPAVVAQAQAVSHDAHNYAAQNYAAQDLPPATAEV